MACLSRNRIPAANSSRFKPDLPLKKAIRITCHYGVHPSRRRAGCGASFATVQRTGPLDGDMFKGTAGALSRSLAASALDAGVGYPLQADRKQRRKCVEVEAGTAACSGRLDIKKPRPARPEIDRIWIEEADRRGAAYRAGKVTHKD